MSTKLILSLDLPAGIVCIDWFSTSRLLILLVRYREKRLKKWNRRWKLELIEKASPDWKDLVDEQI
jgi:putative endonuclease